MNRLALLIVGFFLVFAALTANAQNSKSGIPLNLDPDFEVVIKKVLVSDCRVVRGFLGTPVDGSVYSWDYRGVVREYPNTASDGVSYSFNRNDGLHITLSDEEGFDAVVLRGDARSRMYVNSTALVEPKNLKPAWEFVGSKEVQTAYFDRRQNAKQLSFFGAEGGTIADVSFYRIEKSRFSRDLGSWSPERELELPQPKSEFDSENLKLAMGERYPKGDHQALDLRPDAKAKTPLRFQKGEAIHFITPAFDDDSGLVALTLDGKISDFSKPISMTVVVQDPLDPRLDLTWVDLLIAEPGEIHLKLDIPDQVLIKGSQLWVSLRFDGEATFSNGQGGALEFGLSLASKEEVKGEALVWRKLLLKSFFSLLSEPRPWGSYRNQSRHEFYASSRYARQCPELFMTIDRCFDIDPSDDMVRQYREWVYSYNIEDFVDISPPPTPPSGVPRWAWYSRLAWLEVRRIANWWIEERMVETGEFGGRVGDDSDLYQQFADLPFFETDGVAAKLKSGAARMAELADRENLSGGINRHTTDALHAYEEGINHLALMARWFYGDPIYLERCMESARNMEKLTILTEDGRRHFRDLNRMGAEDLQRPRPPGIDGHAAPLMWHTALQTADYNRNQAAIKTLQEWADSWLKFMRPGQWATDVEAISGKVVGFQKDRPLYGGYLTQASTFSWLCQLSKEMRYLEPFLYYYRQSQAPYPADRFLGDAYTLGALDDLNGQTVENLKNYSPALSIYRDLNPNPLISATIGSPKGRSQEVGTLFDSRRWPDMYTITHQFTDRVFLSLLQHASISYLGGFCRRNKFNPTHAVSWEGFGTDYSALVVDNKGDRLRVLVYNFADKPIRGKMRLWQLEHGRYQLITGLDISGDLQMDKVEKSETLELMKADAVELTLSPNRTTVVEFQQLEKLEKIFSRADLAVAEREVKLDGNTLSGSVHNIGSADVADVVVAVIDAEGKTVVRQSLGPLAAPLDLFPKKVDLKIELPEPPKKGWKLVVDPEGRISEIYEGNNEVEIKISS